MLRWIDDGFVKALGDESGDLWENTQGRDLRVLPDFSHRWKRVVACLNIWNDLPALEATYETWYPHVDDVIAVDGAYGGMPTAKPWSTDGTLEFLQELDKVEVITTDRFWNDQVEKRSAYFQKAKSGDLLFIVDADEKVEGAEVLGSLPWLDVGWILYENPLYTRTQTFPRILRYRQGMTYQTRHHYIHDRDGPVTTCQIGGKGREHRFVPVRVKNARHGWRTDERLRAARIHRSHQTHLEKERDPNKQTGGVEPLRIVQLGTIDPGMVIYRLHSAINTTTPHQSVMAVLKRDRPYHEPYQWHLKDDREMLRQYARTADLVHCHLDYLTMDMLAVPGDSPVVIHHHGTMYRRDAENSNVRDRHRASLRLISNFELLKYGDNLHWLPNPVPYARYAKLAQRRYNGWKKNYLRIAHSPSKPELKGTDVLIRAVDRLKTKGIRVDLRMVHKDTHENSLIEKARADVCFDSFWLGVQCAGLEAGAMGKPVLAGDDEVRSVYVERFGQAPYLYVDDEDAVVEELARLATDHTYFTECSSRISTYVLDHHDYGAVAQRYLDLLDEAVGWRQSMNLSAFRGRMKKQ